MPGNQFHISLEFTLVYNDGLTDSGLHCLSRICVNESKIFVFAILFNYIYI
jgi:hypothetical protein